MQSIFKEHLSALCFTLFTEECISSNFNFVLKNIESALRSKIELPCKREEAIAVVKFEAICFLLWLCCLLLQNQNYQKQKQRKIKIWGKVSTLLKLSICILNFNILYWISSCCMLILSICVLYFSICILNCLPDNNISFPYQFSILFINFFHRSTSNIFFS